ncbi:MAG: hypothetical protein RMK33_00150 [Arcobacter sp.]|nr:hypothetical protein [Arcobacter sp.]
MAYVPNLRFETGLIPIASGGNYAVITERDEARRREPARLFVTRTSAGHVPDKARMLDWSSLTASKEE